MINRTPEGEALTELILNLFRLDSRFINAGDRLVSCIGLTSARWQVLGAIVEASQPQPVSWLARDLGANRQNVQRIVNDLHKEELVLFEPNPHHRRAKLIVLTDKGRKIFEEAMNIQAPWINGLSTGLSDKEIKSAHKVLRFLCHKLENE